MILLHNIYFIIYFLVCLCVYVGLLLSFFASSFFFSFSFFFFFLLLFFFTTLLLLLYIININIAPTGRMSVRFLQLTNKSFFCFLRFLRFLEKKKYKKFLTMGNNSSRDLTKEFHKLEKRLSIDEKQRIQKNSMNWLRGVSMAIE